MSNLFRIALASPVFPTSTAHALEQVELHIREAAARGAKIVCFPESYVPGMRGIGLPIDEHSPASLEAALQHTQRLAKENQIAVILPMDWDDPRGILNVAYVVSAEGTVLGCQTKNQLDPAEDEIFVAGEERQVFEAAGLTFGIAICHEGFRYPETVRWAATRGAKLVFHPHCTGGDAVGSPQITEWRGPSNRYFEHAMVCRALENDVFFASINYGFKFPESATCVVDPLGNNVAHQPYGQPGVLVADIDLDLATGRYANRFRPDAYRQRAT